MRRITGSLLLIGLVGLLVGASPAQARTGGRWKQVRFLNKTLCYQAWGRPAAPALVLLHGNATSSHTWRRNVRELGRHFQVLSLDLPGFGRSDDLGFTLAGFSAGLRRILSAEKVRQAVLVGNSMGGGIAAHFAARYPRRVRALVLVDPDGFPGSQTMSLDFGRLQRALGGLARARTASALRRYRAVIRGILPHVYRNPADLDDLTTFYGNYFLKPKIMKALVGVARRFRAYDGRKALQQSRRRPPLLLVWGEHDKWYDLGNLEQWLQTFPRARLALFGGAAHLPHEDQPHLFNQLLIQTFGRRQQRIFHPPLVPGGRRARRRTRYVYYPMVASRAVILLKQRLLERQGRRRVARALRRLAGPAPIACGRLVRPLPGDPRGGYRHLQTRVLAWGDCRRGGPRQDKGLLRHTVYAGHGALSPAYWVYRYPFWYLWQRKGAPRRIRPRIILRNPRGVDTLNPPRDPWE